MISLDRDRCRRCGVCSERMKGYCISTDGGYPVFDAELCNACQKCVAICPTQAILVNGTAPDRIGPNPPSPRPEEVLALLSRRRSIKKFEDRPIPDEVLEKILGAAAFAPNQNKNISLHVVTDRGLIGELDRTCLKFVRRMHAILFGFPPLTAFISLFYPDIGVIRRKMEYGGFQRVIYENAQAVVIMSGKRSVPVTESSAHYLLATLSFAAESLGVGSCLFDSAYLALRTDARARARFGIRDDVLGAILLGYSAEGIVNVPKGYRVPLYRNGAASRFS